MKTVRHHERSAGESRRGFSLLEVLLASALATVLLATLWSALTLHLRLFDSGLVEVEQAQLARALFARIATDLERTIPPAPELGASAVVEGSGSRLSSAASNSSSSNAVDESVSNSAATSFNLQHDDSTNRSATAMPGAPTREGAHTAAVLGTRDRLRIQIVREMPESLDGANRDLQGPSDPAASMLRTIEYEMVSVSEDELLSAGDASMMVEPAMTTLTRHRALVRSESSTADAQASQAGAASHLTAGASPTAGQPAFGSQSASTANIGPVTGQPNQRAIEAPGSDAADVDIIPEVANVAFRYFDGHGWNDSWNSDAAGVLPVAVEIVIEFRAPTEDEPSNDRAIVNDTDLHDRTTAPPTVATPAAVGISNPTLDPRIYRVVARLPAAGPAEASSRSVLGSDFGSAATSVTSGARFP